MPILSGCVRSQQQGADAVYSIDPRFLIFASIAAWGTCFGGWLLRRTRRDQGTLLIAAGVLILFGTLPVSIASWVRVGPNSVEWRRGFVHHSVAFSEVRQISYLRWAPTQTATDVVNHEIVFTMRSGDRVSLHADESNPPARASAGEILIMAENRGIPLATLGRGFEGRGAD